MKTNTKIAVLIGALFTLATVVSIADVILHEQFCRRPVAFLKDIKLVKRVVQNCKY